MTRRCLCWKVIGYKHCMVIWELERKEVSCSLWAISHAEQRVSVKKGNVCREGRCLAFLYKVDFSKKVTKAGVLFQDMFGLIGSFSDI